MTDKYRHGGPYDRGMADVYYNRSYDPHYYEGATYSSKRIDEEFMTLEEVELYREGYQNGIEDRAYRKNYD